MCGTCSLCQGLKDTELRSYHNGTGQRHGYYCIAKGCRHNSCPECNPLQEVLRNSIKSHKSISYEQSVLRKQPQHSQSSQTAAEPRSFGMVRIRQEEDTPGQRCTDH